MTENGKRKVVRMHPAVAENFRKINSEIDRAVDGSRKFYSSLKDEEKAREALERQQVKVGDLFGKQVPFKYQINIPFPGGEDSPVTGTVNVSKDGPFVCRRIYASLLITDAPVINYDLPLFSGTFDYSDFIGRYAPVTSRKSYWLWARPNSDVNHYGFSFFYRVPPPFDYEWDYNDSGLERERQDKPVSGDILTRKDGDGYLMNNEVFTAGTTISFTARPTRPVTTISFYFEEIDETISGEIDVELQVTFDGFKVLQPLEVRS